MSCIKSLCTFFLFALISFETAAQKAKTKLGFQPYNWKNVQIVGGGFVDGIIFHPKAKGIRYCRTDMGGAYRWNDKAKLWEPLLDFLSYKDRNLMGVESIAVDPNDPGFVILACGTYTNARTGNGAILRSFDHGKTFQRTNVPFKFGGNENGRGNGERMMVDPKNGNIIYLGTRLNGLWKSRDKGKTWNQVKTFPDITESIPQALESDSIQRRRFQVQNMGSGIVMTVFDHRNASKDFSTVYVFASLMGRNNLFRSDDNGNTWTAVPGQPVNYRPTHAVLAEDGMLYITYGSNPGPFPMTDGDVWKLNTNTGQWLEITPDKPSSKDKKEFGYAAVAVDAQHPQTLMVTTYNRYNAGGEEIFRSTDAGKTWKPVLKGLGTFDYSAAPYIAHTSVHWMFDLEIDPFDSDHALFTTGYGGHETFHLTDIDKNKTITWTVMGKGIEETVALDLLSPPKGADLVSAIGDYGGFVHWNPDQPEPKGNFTNPHFGNTDGLACAENNPALIVRVGIASNGNQENIGYSLDSGHTWQSANKPLPNSAHGHIAVSADGKNWIWTPQRSPAFVTHDYGKSWEQAKDIPENLKVIADKVNPLKFYALSLFEGRLYTSTDGGNHFAERALGNPVQIPKRGSLRGDIRGGQDRIYTTPGKEGDLWLAAFDGLYHSTDAGQSFVAMDNVTEIHGFGFGKAAPRLDYPSLYLIGVINGVSGIFRSDDSGKNWIRINDDLHQWGLLLHITGDPQKWGRVYIGTHGRGIFYGDPLKK